MNYIHLEDYHLVDGLYKLDHKYIISDLYRERVGKVLTFPHLQGSRQTNQLKYRSDLS